MLIKIANKMKKGVWISVASLVFLIIFSGFWVFHSEDDHQKKWSETVKPNAVNAVIGDESFRAVYDKEPTAATSEQKRIVTHLKYVRKKLLHRDVGYLSKRKRQLRRKNLNRLKDYIQRGEFPKNKAFSNRRPNFIDSKGRICAVGYLVEQSLGRRAAEALNEKFQYEYVLEMESPKLRKWATENGFTTRELAMIQPSYGDDGWGVGPEENKNKMSRTIEYGILGVNVGLSAVNGYLGIKKSGSVIPATAGIALGASTITMGLTDKTRYSTADFITGGLSVAVGSWAMYSIFNKKSSSNNLTVAPVPSSRFNGNMGISINYRF